MVSVVIPNYNHAPFLKKRIDSILNQTYQDFELIILDDCSTDNSKSIIEPYRNHTKVNHIVYNKENSGSTFKQWKKGIELAKGQYVWIAESDDWADNSFLENLLSNIDKNISIAFCQSKRVWNEQDSSNKAHYNKNSIVYNGLNFISNYMLLSNTIENASMAIFAKDKVDLDWFDKLGKFKYCGDWFFWIKLSENGDVLVCPNVLNYFRQHSTKVTNRAKKEGLDFIEGVKILDYVKNNLKLKISKSVIAHWSYIWTQNRVFFDKGIAKKTIKKLIEFDPLFLYYIPYYMILKRIKTHIYK